MFRFIKNVLETTILSKCPCFLFSNYYSNKYFVGNRPLAYAVKATVLEDESKEYHELFDLFNVNYEVVLQIGRLAYYIVQEVYTWILQTGFTVKLNVKCPYFAFEIFFGIFIDCLANLENIVVNFFRFFHNFPNFLFSATQCFSGLFLLANDNARNSKLETF